MRLYAGIFINMDFDFSLISVYYIYEVIIMTIKEIIITELNDFPDEKAESLLDYIHFLKYESRENSSRIPNRTTKKTFKNTDNGKGLNTYSSVDDFFNKMGV